MTDEERVWQKFVKTSVRWYPSEKKVFTLKFRLLIRIKMIGNHVRHFIWKIKNGYL